MWPDEQSDSNVRDNSQKGDSLDLCVCVCVCCARLLFTFSLCRASAPALSSLSRAYLSLTAARYGRAQS